MSDEIELTASTAVLDNSLITSHKDMIPNGSSSEADAKTASSEISESGANETNENGVKNGHDANNSCTKYNKTSNGLRCNDSNTHSSVKDESNRHDSPLVSENDSKNDSDVVNYSIKSSHENDQSDNSKDEVSKAKSEQDKLSSTDNDIKSDHTNGDSTNRKPDIKKDVKESVDTKYDESVKDEKPDMNSVKMEKNDDDSGIASSSSAVKPETNECDVEKPLDLHGDKKHPDKNQALKEERTEQSFPSSSDTKDIVIEDEVIDLSKPSSSNRDSSRREVVENQARPNNSPAQKPSKPKPPPDNMRAVGRLLYDLGLDLVRQEVYKDLIDIQAAKDDEHKLDDKEKGQLIKLTEAHARLRSKNGAYCIPRIRCAPHCRYSSTSENVLRLHREYGHLSTSQAGMHVCCLCENFRTKFPSQFVNHMETVHLMNGKLIKKPALALCSYCPYEHKNSNKVDAHAAKCGKKFQLSVNLQPLPSDCDIPIKQRPQPANWSRQEGGGATNQGHGVNPRDVASQNARYSSGASGASQSSTMEIGGQMYSWGNQRGKPTVPPQRSHMGSSSSTGLNMGGSGMPASNSINMACSSSGVMRPLGMQHRMASPHNQMNRNSSSSAGSSGSQQQQRQQQQQMSNRPQQQTPPNRQQPQQQPQQRQNPGKKTAEMCEICGTNLENRQALWSHLHNVHKLELSKVSMNEQEPCIVCDICKARFWTYQGLARHSLLLHKRNISSGSSSSAASSPSTSGAAGRAPFRCHLCGASQTVNPLNHLSTHHNITLLDMYHGRQCCMCNCKLRNGRAFEDHMVKEHRDIFANQDVLRTVLQALSTALYLKSEDIHQSRSPHSQQPQSRQQQQIQQAANAAALAIKGASGSAGSAAMLAKSQQSVKGEKKDRSSKPPPSKPEPKPETKPEPKPETKPEPITLPTKPTPEKKTTEEETKAMNKFYKDYADIGRPISRAMKHKLLRSPDATSGSSAEKQSNGDQEHEDGGEEGAEEREVPLKKARPDEGKLNASRGSEEKTDMTVS